MNRSTLIAVMVLIALGCDGAKPNDVKPLAWPPRSDHHDQEASTIPADAQLLGGPAKEDPLQQMGDEVLGFDGRFWPKEGAYKISGGFVTRIGEIEKKARFGGWTYIYKGLSREEKSSWGPCLTDGEILISKSSLENSPENAVVDNLFQLADFGDKYFLVRLDPSKGHRMCVLLTGSGYQPTVGFVGSRAEVDGIIVERRKDGWYQGDRKVGQ